MQLKIYFLPLHSSNFEKKSCMIGYLWLHIDVTILKSAHSSPSSKSLLSNGHVELMHFANVIWHIMKNHIFEKKRSLNCLIFMKIGIIPSCLLFGEFIKYHNFSLFWAILAKIIKEPGEREGLSEINYLILGVSWLSSACLIVIQLVLTGQNQ